MSGSERTVETVDARVAATNDGNVRKIAVKGRLANAPSIRLSPGQSLAGAGAEAGVTFAAGTDGLQLSCDNRICNICLGTSPDKRAIFNDTSVASLGQTELSAVTTTGCVQILAIDKLRSGHIEVNGLDIVAAD